MPRTTRILAMGVVGKSRSTLAGLDYPALHSNHNIYNFQKLGLAQGKARQGETVARENDRQLGPPRSIQCEIGRAVPSPPSFFFMYPALREERGKC